MAQSSRYFKIDNDVLLEFIYHDQANASDYDIDVDDNGSEIKVLDTVQGDHTKARHLIHELGSDVVNFDVTEAGAYIAIEGFAARTLLLEVGKTYKFNLSLLATPTDFAVTGNSLGSPYDAVSGIYSYVPNITGSFEYTLTNFIGGKVTVGNIANPLFATPDEETGNSIKTGAGTIGRYHAVNVEENKYALLDSTNTFINDPSWSGSDSADLLQNQSDATLAINHIRYDKIRLHLRSGFSFASRGYEGFLFELKTDRTSGIQNFLTQIVYLNTSNFEIKNPKPFILSETLYNSFIEIKVPTFIGQYQEFEDFFYGDNTVGSSDLSSTSNFNATFKLIDAVEDTTGIDYFYTGEEQNFVISREDEFQDFAVVIEEATDGDYFKLYGEKDGSAADFEQYIINRITESSDDISVIFDITVFENVGVGFIETYNTSITQVQDFEEPIEFRPIIKNANTASSFAIDVVMRIYNQTDNTQIVKNASLTYNNAAKYGKRLMKVNISSTANLTRVYNTLPDLQATRNVAQVLNNALPKAPVKYAPTFVERVDVVVDSENVAIEDGLISGLGKTSTLSISPFDTYIKFTVSKTDGDELKGVSFTNLKNVKLTFSSGMSFNNITSFKDIDMGKGEVLFQINKANATKLKGLADKSYYISIDNGSTETLVYRGEYTTV
tara:strand:- start:12881 stop:14881 length:2001 start_codon:yes stop_codon:yes gene_type:complete